MTGWNFGWRLISETPSTLVVAPISFFCLCGQGADHTRNLALWNLPRAEVALLHPERRADIINQVSIGVPKAVPAHSLQSDFSPAGRK